MVEPNQDSPMKKIVISKFFSIFLWAIFCLFILAQLSIVDRVLEEMATSGKVFPLNHFLSYFDQLWLLIDTLFSTILTSQGYEILFYEYAFGGFTYATLIWSLRQYTFKQIDSNVFQINKLKHGWLLNLFFSMTLVISIFYGYNRDLWVPYVQDPSWQINLVHMQQIQAGSFLIFYIITLTLCSMKQIKGKKGAQKFVTSFGINIYVFLIFTLLNLAAFNWFPYGYEEIFRYGQSFLSIDKVFHFTGSSALIVILMTYGSSDRTKQLIGIAVSLVVLWELFEISLNPLEASDSLFDMIINTTAIILSAVIYEKFVDESINFQSQLE